MNARRIEREEPRRATGGTRAGRVASTRRRAHSQRLRYRDALRVVAAVGALTAAVMIYLGILANVTRLHYDIARAQRERAALEAQTMRLDERLAQLEAPDRLVAIAQQLGMRDAHAYAVVTLPPASAPAPRHDAYALLGAVTGLHR
jgi:hypothetical protein